MTKTTNHRRPRRTVVAIASAALALSVLGASGEIAAASERASTDTGNTVAASEPAPRAPADLTARPGVLEIGASELLALSIIVEKCLDDLDAGACANGGSSG